MLLNSKESILNIRGNSESEIIKNENDILVKNLNLFIKH